MQKTINTEETNLHVNVQQQLISAIIDHPSFIEVHATSSHGTNFKRKCTHNRCHPRKRNPKVLELHVRTI